VSYTAYSNTRASDGRCAAKSHGDAVYSFASFRVDELRMIQIDSYSSLVMTRMGSLN
jgi:hypothetical protein